MTRTNTQRSWSSGRLAWVRRALTFLSAVLGLTAAVWADAPTGAGPAAPAGVPASRQAANVAIITIQGGIDETTFRSVQRRLKLAERAGADAIVIELDTPGGEVGAVLKICQAIKSSPIKNTVAWVNRDAYSGGAIIALACREIVVNDPSKLGDALPVTAAPGVGLLGSFNNLPEHERQKVLSPLIAEIVESARLFGRDELLVQGLVSRGVELWLVQNNATGEMMTINASEYRTLFGEEPSRGAAALAAAPSLAGQTPAVQPGPPRPDSRSAGKRTLRRAPRTPAAVPPGVIDDPHPFIPASPELAGLRSEMAQRPVQAASTRPVFTSADRGNWTLVEYVSTGDGPFVFSAGQMLHYGIADEFVRSDEELKAYLGSKHLLRLNASWSEGLVSFLTLLPVRGLLLVVFLLGLFIEMTHPGAFLPGLVAVAALAGLLAPPLLIDLANWWEIAAILGGILLILLEIFVIPGFGIPGIAGVLLVMGGLIGTFVPEGALFPDTPAQERGLTYGAVTMLLSVVTAGALMYVVARHFGSLPVLNRLVLKDAGPPGDEEPGDEMLRALAEPVGPVKVGSVGVALTPLRPAGRVEVEGRVVDVVADGGFIPAGASVRVTSSGEFRITVDRA